MSLKPSSEDEADEDDFDEDLDDSDSDPAPKSPEEQAYLDAVLADPDSDAPRLLYASYLRAKGDPRGDFIETQCALAKRPPLSDRLALQAKEKALLRENGQAWQMPLAHTRLRGTFRRGFIDEVRGYNFANAAPHLEGLLSLEPVRKVSFATIDEGDLKKLLKMGVVERLRSLGVSQIPGTKLVRALARSLKTSSLRSLRLGSGGLDKATAKVLAQSPAFAGIERLNMTGSGLDDEVLLALLKAKPLFRPIALYFTRCELTSDGLIALISSPLMERLSILCISHNEDIDTEAFVELAQSKSSETLTFLEVKGTWLSEEGARALAESPFLSNLQSLRIAGTPVVEERGEGLARLRERWGRAVVIGGKYP